MSPTRHIGNRELRYLKEARDACQQSADRANRRAVFVFVVCTGLVGILLLYLILTQP